MNSTAGVKKKILFVITKGNWGGAQKYVYDLATSLSPTTYDVVVALGEGEKLAEKLARQNIRTLKLKHAKRDIKLSRDFNLTLNLIDLFKQERPDIVHLNSSKIGIVGALAARLAGVKKIIFTAHGWAFNEDRPLWQRTALAIAHWLTVILTHETICVAEREYRQMTLFPFTRHKLKVIKNGIADTHFLTREEARQHLRSLTPLAEHISPEDYWLGAIAELHKNKGLDFLIEAVGELAGKGLPIRTFVIGEGEERAKLEKLIAVKNLHKNFFLLGELNDAKQYLPAFDLFVLPSRKEGLPFALLEAGQAGLPVIASRVGGIPEVINESTGILTGAGNIKELVAGITKLASDQALAEKLATNLKHKIETEFSLEQVLTKTEEAYK